MDKFLGNEAELNTLKAQLIAESKEEPVRNTKLLKTLPSKKKVLAHVGGPLKVKQETYKILIRILQRAPLNLLSQGNSTRTY